jgi:predicted dehydrogenase
MGLLGLYSNRRHTRRMQTEKSRIVLIGCGFVADLYMKSFAQYPHIEIVGAYDERRERRQAFCTHWAIPPVHSLDAALQLRPDVLCNLTNPASHYEVTRKALLAGIPTYSEKPLAMEMEQAKELYRISKERGVMLSSAPCSVLSDTAQTLLQAIRDELAGPAHLIYAQLDDGFISQAPYRDWVSESGAPWPYENEFKVGCTLEHAGYYLTWLIACFGPVKTVVSASALVAPGKLDLETPAPDFSVGILFFESGVVARLTCSIVAPRDHRLCVVCQRGDLEVGEAWNNAAPVKLRRRFAMRRRLIIAPIARRVRMRGNPQIKVPRTGAARMNFALGPVEMLDAITDNRTCRIDADFALHVNEVTLAIQNAGAQSGAQTMSSTCQRMEPLA